MSWRDRAAARSASVGRCTAPARPLNVNHGYGAGTLTSTADEEEAIQQRDRAGGSSGWRQCADPIAPSVLVALTAQVRVAAHCCVGETICGRPGGRLGVRCSTLGANADSLLIAVME
jgi:hypothetical protein